MYQLFEDDVWDLLLEEMEDSADNFTGSFRLTTRLPRSREFSVSNGFVQVKSSARWNYPSPRVCPINRYQIRLWGKIPDISEMMLLLPFGIQLALGLIIPGLDYHQVLITWRLMLSMVILSVFLQ